MKTKNLLITSVLALSSLMIVGNTWADHRNDGGWFDGHRGEHSEHRNGHGWFGKGKDCGKRGDHRGKDGWGHGKYQQNLKLNAEQVNTLMQAKLIRSNSTLKLGDVKAGENNTFDVSFMNAEGSLVKQVTISGATGYPVEGKRELRNLFYNNKQAGLSLTPEQAKTVMQAKLIKRGNERLKVGTVTEGENNTLVVEILTIDDSLVEKVSINKTTGRRI